MQAHLDSVMERERPPVGLFDGAPAPLLPPRDYQEAALSAALTAYSEGAARLLVVLPTGAGKTIVFGHLIRRLGVRAVILVHRDELAAQAVAKIHLVIPGAPIGVVKAERDDVTAPVIVASAQTLARPERLARLRAATDGAPLLVVSDEAHHDRAETRTRAIEALAPRYLLGVTATPERGDGLSLRNLYERIVYQQTMLEAMRLGHLCNLRGVRVGTDIRLDAVHTRGGEFVEGELAAAVDVDERNRLVVEAWRKHAEGRQRTVVFAASVAHAAHLVAAFRATAGVRADLVTGETPREERRALLSAFSEGTLPVLGNCEVLTEGYDEPRIDCIVLARPTQSRALYVQMVGRGARPAPGKADCLILDVADMTRRHTLMTLPALLDAPDAETPRTDRRRAGEACDLLGMAAAEDAAAGVKLAARTEEVDLFGRSPFLWRQVGAFYYHESAPREWIVIAPTRAGGYVPVALHKTLTGNVTREMLHPEAVDLGSAQALAEREAVAAVWQAFNRRDTRMTRAMRAEPPSPRQHKIALGMGITIRPDHTAATLQDAISDERFKRAWRRARNGSA